MHRTGTSALSGVLHSLGAVAPANLQVADENNARGYWESWRIVQLNNQILEASGSRWDDWTAFDDQMLDPAAKAKFEDDIVGVLATEFGAAPLISLKDPRICRLVPLWERALARAGFDPRFIIPVRNPLESALSLRARDKMPIPEGQLLWLRHLLDAERFTRGRRRCFLSFSALLENWRTAAERIARTLEISWPNDIRRIGQDVEQFLDLELRHQNNSRQDLALQTGSAEWVVPAYDALEKLSADADSHDEQLARLDPIYTQFDRATRIFGPLISRRDAALVALGKQATMMTEELARRTGETERYQKELAEVSAALSRCEAELALSIGQTKQLSRDLKSLRRRKNAARRIVRSIFGAKGENSLFSVATIKRLRFGLGGNPGENAEKTDRTELDDVELIRSSDLFDAAWYLETYPDVRGVGIDPALHYLRRGGSEGRDPSSRFSTTAYQQRYPDVKVAGINPLLHYLKRGGGEGRQFEASQLERSTSRKP